MTGALVPFRSGRGATSALAAIDVTAADLLREGRAATLSSARLDVIRSDLLAKRVELIAVINDLRARRPSDDVWIDAINATLLTQAGTGLSYIDQLLEQVELCASHVG